MWVVSRLAHLGGRTAVEFEQQAQEDLYARVQMHLRDCFGELAEAIEEEPGFVVELGSTRFLVTVDANGPEKASVLLFKMVGDGILITAEVEDYILRRVHELPLIAVSLSDEDRISVRQVILGEAVTRDNVSMMLRMFAANCEDIEDELTMQFR